MNFQSKMQAPSGYAANALYDQYAAEKNKKNLELASNHSNQNSA